MSEKRTASSTAVPPRAKRSRFEPVEADNGVAAASAPKVQAAKNGTSIAEKLERARALLANKDALKAQVQALKERKALSANTQSSSLSKPSLPGGISAKEPAYRPAPLRIDEKGREIDAFGRIIEKPIQAQRKAEGKAKEPEPPKGPRPEEFIDPTLTDKSFKRLERRQRAGFDFVKAGTFQKEADQRRLKAVYGDQALKQQKEKHESEKKASVKADHADPNLVPLGERAPPPRAEPAKEPIPDIEWWDAALLLQFPQSYDGDEDEVAINEKRITIYVEHPVPLEPPAEDAPPPPMPLPLTAKERKKLRTQRRLEKEKEKQELIRQGLLEPPKPKLKLSTFYRSMGVEAAADPTAMEQQVRADQDARLQAHEDRNLANKLTPAEKREKKIRKLTGAANEGEAKHVSLYRLTSLATPQHRFKVRANAEELHMTGCAVITDDGAVVVVEGGPKAQKKYAHVLLNRIKWNPDADDNEGEDQDRPQNKCIKVWTGTVKAAAFEKFVLESCRSEAAARKFLADRGIEHYWDLAMADVEE